MKLAQKFMIVTLIAVLIFAVGVLGACRKPHTHTYSSEWSSDKTSHWHKSTCEHADEVSDKANHNFVNGVCSECKYIFGELQFVINLEQTAYSVIGIGTVIAADIVIPATYMDLPVTHIGESAFRDCENLKTVTFSENSQLTTIGNYAFNGCENLTNINIPQSVTSIGVGAFYWCKSLKEISIPTGILSISSRTFYLCISLKSIVIPSSVTSIGEDAFISCNELQTVYYGGTQQQWENIVIEGGNTALTNATLNYLK